MFDGGSEFMVALLIMWTCYRSAFIAIWHALNDPYKWMWSFHGQPLLNLDLFILRKMPWSITWLTPQSHQNLHPVQTMKLLGTMLRNRCWPTTFHTITTGDVDKWCAQPLIEPIMGSSPIRFTNEQSQCPWRKRLLFMCSFPRVGIVSLIYETLQTTRPPFSFQIVSNQR